MGKLKEKAAEYHEEFATRIIKALEAATAPWQKPCPPCYDSRPRPSSFRMARKHLNSN